MFDSLGTPPDYRVLVTTNPDPVLEFDGHLIRVDSEEINISKWWNRGLDFIRAHTNHDIWDVLVAETDARMSPLDVEELRSRMREVGAVMAGGDWEHTLPAGAEEFHRISNESLPVGRIPGIMKVVAGETGIRHDPEFRWWLADDDYEWQHRISGGTLLVAGIEVQHTGTQGPLSGERLQAWEEDQTKFFDKWGGMPITNGVLS
jgi:hypothetical protein